MRPCVWHKDLFSGSVLPASQRKDVEFSVSARHYQPAEKSSVTHMPMGANSDISFHRTHCHSDQERVFFNDFPTFMFQVRTPDANPNNRSHHERKPGVHAQQRQ